MYPERSYGTGIPLFIQKSEKNHTSVKYPHLFWGRESRNNALFPPSLSTTSCHQSLTVTEPLMLHFHRCCWFVSTAAASRRPGSSWYTVPAHVPTTFLQLYHACTRTTIQYESSRDVVHGTIPRSLWRGLCRGACDSEPRGCMCGRIQRVSINFDFFIGCICNYTSSPLVRGLWTRFGWERFSKLFDLYSIDKLEKVLECNILAWERTFFTGKSSRMYLGIIYIGA
jgi:hypothetical protein